MRILITGGSGFIASHVIKLLLRENDVYIVNVDKLDYCSCNINLNEFTRHCENYKFIKGDICSSDLINHILHEEQIDTIMHFAAQTHVDNSFGNSFDFTHNNIFGTHVLLECTKNYGKITKFIHVSTDEVYGEQRVGEIPRIENSILEPTNPYAATKAAAEFLVKSYAHSFGIPIIITRGNNVYGPHQFPEKIIPKFICQILDRRKITIHGSGESMRNFLYVDDVARAFRTILLNGRIGEIYNIGGTSEKSVYDIARILLMKMTDELPDCGHNFEFVEDRPFNDLRYSIDSSKLKELGWEEETSFDDGLDMTIQWYFKYRGRYRYSL